MYSINVNHNVAYGNANSPHNHSANLNLFYSLLKSKTGPPTPGLEGMLIASVFLKMRQDHLLFVGSET